MCNARNHAPHCRCGWGGGYGAGGSGSTTRTLTTRFAAPTWSGTRAPTTHESYTNPNATCPVCGARVFFYRSPHGGRVFFDELGVPWPKHPCTDTSFHRRFAQVRLTRPSGAGGGAGSARAIRSPEVGTPRHAWRPLLFTAPVEMAAVSRVRLRDTSVPGFLYLPEQYLQQPAVWRWSPSTPGHVDISTFATTHDGDVLPQQVSQPGCLLQDADWRRHQRGDRTWTGQQLVALGLAAAGGVGVGPDPSRDHVLAHQLLWQALFLVEPTVEHLVVLDNVTRTLLGANDQSSRGEARARLQLHLARRNAE